jgi:hypothetical protein
MREDAFYGGTHTAIYGGSKRIAPSKTSLFFLRATEICNDNDVSP